MSPKSPPPAPGDTGEKKERTCLTCPAYRDAHRYSIVAGRSIGVSMCATRQIVLNLPTIHASDTDLQERLRATAAACPSYGSAGKPVSDSVPLVYDDGPDRSDLAQLAIKAEQPEAVTSCSGCAYFVNKRQMLEDFSVGAGACTIFKTLIHPAAEVRTAQSCPVKSFNNSGAAATLTDADFGGWLDYVDPTVAASLKVLVRTKFIEPTEYESDDEVTADEAAKGIRAWRKVTDPTDEDHYVMLPIFRRDFFPAEEQDKIPATGDDEHPELYIDHSDAVYKTAVLWMALDETPAVWGEPGVGKTELFRHLAWMMQLPFERISITATSEVDDLAGKMLFVDGETKFQYGRVPRAWMKPCVIVVDEPNVGPAEVWHFLRPLTDNSKQMVLDANKGERILRNDHAFMGMAMNPAWDMRNRGAEDVADADSSRLMHIFIDLPPKDIEMKIISDRVSVDGWKIPVKHLEQLMSIATEIRKLSKEGGLPITWGVRNQIKVARTLRWFGPADAYRIAAADFLDPDSQEALLTLVRLAMTERVKV